MRLVSFLPPSSTSVHVGALAPDGVRIVDLTAIGVADMFDAVARAGALARVAGHLLHAPGAVAWRVSDVRLLAPLPGARTAHLLTSPVLPVAGEGPALRFDDPRPLLGDGARVTPRDGDRWLACLAVIVGADGHGMDAEAGERHVGGIALAGRWLGDDALAAPVLQLGPCVMPAAMLASHRPPGSAGFALAARVSVDGREVASGTLAALPLAPGALVAAAAARHTVRVGDVLTMPLRASAGGWLATSPGAGDQVTFEVERLGALTMRAAAERQTVSIGE